MKKYENKRNKLRTIKLVRNPFLGEETNISLEIDFHERETITKNEKMRELCEKYRRENSEKDEMVRSIKRDIDIVEMDVRKSNQLLQAEQELR